MDKKKLNIIIFRECLIFIVTIIFSAYLFPILILYSQLDDDLIIFICIIIYPTIMLFRSIIWASRTIQSNDE
jgi:hypothetical protein